MRSPSVLLAAALSIAVAGPLSAGETGFVLADRGRTEVTIVLPRELAKPMGDKVRDFAEALRKSTGAEFPVAEQASGGKTIRLAAEPAPDRDPESFRITFPDADTVLISGGSQLGLSFALADFPERYLGFRWLFPGPEGECVPDRRGDRIEIARREVRESPAFLSRHLGAGAFSPKTVPFYRWSRDKLKANNYRIMHGENMSFLFPVEQYGREHPEFYPEFHGRRYLPKPEERRFWQPCYSNPALAREAVKNILVRMAATRPAPENLRQYTYSLGINDSNGFCECADCRAEDADSPKNPLGPVSRSPAYLAFIRQAAEGVAKEYPQAKLGFIAYAGVTAVPEKCKLHPALVPHVCVELFQWADPARREVITRLYQAWHDAGIREMGSYDYAWGRGYLLPRLYLRSFADALRALHKMGVRHYRCEFNADDFAAEGPKGYVMLKLLWDPEADVDALLDDWYCHAVGKEAAPYLKEYFDRLERFWTGPALQTAWFEKTPVTYLKTGNMAYLGAYPEAELDKSRELLETALKLAGTPEEKARARYYLDRVKQYTPLVRQYRANLALREKLAAYRFDTVVADYTFDRKVLTLSSWSRKNTRVLFRREEAGGIDHTAALAIDLTMSKRAPGSYVACLKHLGGKRVYRASVMARSDGNVSSTAKISIALQWRDGKKRILNPALNTSTPHPCPATGEWRELVVYGIAPEEAGVLSVALTASHSDGGTVFFDDLKVESAQKEPNR